MAHTKKKTKQSQKKLSRPWLMALLVALPLAVGGGIYAGLFHEWSPKSETLPQAETGPDASPNRGIAVGQAAPDFALERLAGGRVYLSDYLGEVVILDFWAKWCRPCRASMPRLEEFRRRYESRGLRVIAVSLDSSGEEARAYLEENGYGEFVGLWESLSAARNVARTYGVVGIPHTLVIDREGIIRYAGHPLYIGDSLLEPLL